MAEGTSQEKGTAEIGSSQHPSSWETDAPAGKGGPSRAPAASITDSLTQTLRTLVDGLPLLLALVCVRVILNYVYFYSSIYFYFWLCCVQLSLAVANGGYSSLPHTGLSLWRLLLFRSTGSRHAGSVVVVRGL